MIYMKKLFFCIVFTKKGVIDIIYRKLMMFFEIMLFAMTICLADILCGCERRDENADKKDESVSVLADKGEKMEKKTAYLTFDDGPSCLTDKYLDILDDEGVKATFFVIGQQIEGEYKKTIDREIKTGHEIGIHTYTHEADEIYCDCQTYYNDVMKVRDELEKGFGYKPKLVRFPWGSANSYISGYRKNIIGMFKDAGLGYADWNVSAEDSVGNPTAESVMRNIRKDYAKYCEPVLLMHDSGANKVTLSVLKNIITELKEHGYEFDTLSNRSKKCHFYEY